MVNFRFHLVSLTAVFLALAAGIAIGAGVVDRQTVDFLEDRLATVENNRDTTNQRNDELQRELEVWQRYAEESGDRMVEGRLQDVPVVIIGVEGTNREVVERARTTLQAAAANVQGTLWFTEKWALANGEDVEAIATIAGASATSRPADLRGLAISALVSTWTGRGTSDVAVPLRDAGFLDFDPAPNQPLIIEQLALANAEVVIVSSSEATVPNGDLVGPLTNALVDADVDVATAEPTVPDVEDGAEEPAPGAAMVVRADDGLAAQVSTVDNLDDYRGRVALVFAIEALAAGRTGHYGTGDGAQRLLPEASA